MKALTKATGKPVQSEATDHDLVAFTDLYGSHAPTVLGALILHTGDRDVAEELAQETFVRACTHWKQVKRANRPDAWLLRVAFNLANSYYRRKAAERRARQRLDATFLEEQVEEVATAVGVRQALMRLPTRERTAVLLRYFADLRVREIADVMDCPEGTVKTLLHRATGRLKSELGPIEDGDLNNDL